MLTGWWRSCFDYDDGALLAETKYNLNTSPHFCGMHCHEAFQRYARRTRSASFAWAVFSSNRRNLIYDSIYCYRYMSPSSGRMGSGGWVTSDRLLQLLTGRFEMAMGLPFVYTPTVQGGSSPAL